jgi:hypothetical protein
MTVRCLWAARGALLEWRSDAAERASRLHYNTMYLPKIWSGLRRRRRLGRIDELAVLEKMVKAKNSSMLRIELFSFRSSVGTLSVYAEAGSMGL